MLRGLEGWHLIILVAVVAVLFGYKRMPDAARSMGRSMRIFKSEVDTMRKDDDHDKKPGTPAPTPPLTSPGPGVPTATATHPTSATSNQPR